MVKFLNGDGFIITAYLTKRSGWRFGVEKELVRSLYYNPDTDTVDIWIGNPSTESYSEPLTENLVSKHNTRGDTIGLEIITLNKLNAEDMKKMPLMLALS